MTDQKSKMISVRLSWEEYRTYLEACSASGIRSISELARAAMQQLASSHPARSPGEEQLRDLCERVSLLSTELTRIAALVDRQVTGEDTAIDELPQNDSQTPSDPLSTHPDLVRFEAEITALRDRVDAMARQLTLLILESRATKMREAASAG